MALAKLYPTDWNRLQLSDAAAYEAPIDSVGYQMNFMNFKTNDEFTPQTTFAFKDSKGNEHSGWAKISTTGQFFSQVGTLNLSFSVIDLVVDNADCTSVLPLTLHCHNAESQGVIGIRINNKLLKARGLSAPEQCGTAENQETFGIRTMRESRIDIVLSEPE